MEENGKTISATSLISSPSKEVSLIQRILWLLNTFFHQIVAVLTVVMCWLFFDHPTLAVSRLWHLVLSTLAYIPLMAVGIILFSEDNINTIFISRTRKYTIHGILLAVSLAAVTVGIVVETDAKVQAGRTHFVTDHAILGLTSWILMFVSCIIGLMAANTRIFSVFVKPVVIKLIHNILGLAGYATGIASLYVVLVWFERNGSTELYYGIRIAVIFVTIWSCLAALKSLFLQVKAVFS